MRTYNYILLILSLLPSLLFAQDNYQIFGKIDQLKDSSKIYLTYSNEGVSFVDSTISRQGHFTFSGPLDFPVYSAIYLHKNPYVDRPLANEQMDYFRFYLEPAKIEMTAEDSLKNIRLSGSKINQEHSVLREMQEPVDTQFDELKAEYSKLSAEQKKDSSTLAGFIEREKLLMDKNYAVHLEFARQHPHSYLSVISLGFIAGQEKFTDAAGPVYDQLDDHLKESPLGQVIPMQIQSVLRTKIGQIAPELELQSPDGKIIKTSDYRGKYILLDFWASWCGPCRVENPNLVSAYSDYHEKGFEILGISLDNAPQKEAWIGAIQDDGLIWPQVSDLKGWDSYPAKLYGINSIPANFLLDPQGKIIARNLRGKDLQEKLRSIFNTQDN